MKDMDQGTAAVETVSPVDLMRFCSSDEFRPHLQKPFRYRGHVYATDGIILLRVNDSEAHGYSNKVAVEKAVALDVPRVFTKAPAIKSFPKEQPFEKKDCPDCDGCGLEHDFPGCTCTCDSCDGSGEIEYRPKISTTLAAQIFNLEYVRLLYSLPALEIASNPESCPIYTPLYFRFAGGVGALMPMCDKFEIHVDVVMEDMDQGTTAVDTGPNGHPAAEAR